MKPHEVYAELLEAGGLLVEHDSDGRLNFKYEGDDYELRTYENDLQYLGISTSYRILAGVRRLRALEEANQCTRRSKVAKVYVLPKRGVTIAAELFVKDPEQISTILFRLIYLVQGVAAEYFSALAKPAATKLKPE